MLIKNTRSLEKVLNFFTLKIKITHLSFDKLKCRWGIRVHVKDFLLTLLNPFSLSYVITIVYPAYGTFRPDFFPDLTFIYIYPVTFSLVNVPKYCTNSITITKQTHASTNGFSSQFGALGENTLALSGESGQVSH